MELKVGKELSGLATTSLRLLILNGIERDPDVDKRLRVFSKLILNGIEREMLLGEKINVEKVLILNGIESYTFFLLFY